jgi:hypothetical protein
MDPTEEYLLKTNGWDVECESPFEIRHEDGSFASKQAAYYVLNELKSEFEIKLYGSLPIGERFRIVPESTIESIDERTWVKLLYNTIAVYDKEQKPENAITLRLIDGQALKMKCHIVYE